MKSSSRDTVHGIELLHRRARARCHLRGAAQCDPSPAPAEQPMGPACHGGTNTRHPSAELSLVRRRSDAGLCVEGRGGGGGGPGITVDKRVGGKGPEEGWVGGAWLARAVGRRLRVRR